MRSDHPKAKNHDTTSLFSPLSDDTISRDLFSKLDLQSAKNLASTSTRMHGLFYTSPIMQFKREFPFRYVYLAKKKKVDWLKEHAISSAIEYENLSPIEAEIFKCVKNGDEKRARELLDEINNPAIWLKKDSIGMTLSFWAARRNNQDLKNDYYKNMSQYFRDMGITVDHLGYTLLHHAIIANQENDILESLILSGINIDARTKSGSTALHFAVSFNHIKNAVFLLEQGAKFSSVKDLKALKKSVVKYISEMPDNKEKLRLTENILLHRDLPISKCIFAPRWFLTPSVNNPNSSVYELNAAYPALKASATPYIIEDEERVDFSSSLNEVDEQASDMIPMNLIR